MDDTRERELIRAASTLRCRGEIEGFRKQLAAQGEKPTGALNAALLERERSVMPGVIRGGK